MVNAKFFFLLFLHYLDYLKSMQICPFITKGVAHLLSYTIFFCGKSLFEFRKKIYQYPQYTPGKGEALIGNTFLLQK